MHQVNETVQYGDLSAVLLQNTPFWGHWLRTPELSIALSDEWETKIEKLAQSTILYGFIYLMHLVPVTIQYAHS